MRLVNFLSVLILVSSFVVDNRVTKVVKVNRITYSAIDDLPFSEENLMIVMKRFGIRFPEVVLAQARLETGRFTSKSFVDANNLFGMKVAKSRLTVATGERYGHAMYEHWTYSVMDYALFQSTYAKRVRTRDAYMRYLGRNYAQDERYVSKLTKLL